jgi:hypothetical protein
MGQLLHSNTYNCCDFGLIILNACRIYGIRTVLSGKRSLSLAVAAEGTAKELTFSVLMYCISEDKKKG